MKKFNIRNYNDNDFKAFLKNNKSDLDISINNSSSSFSWVEIFQEYMPVIDGIVRNPRRFIQSDESLVPLEKATKFTEESVKHLAQHTQLIQDIDEGGMPQPLKVLNVFKEETYDIYENRFIHSLVSNLNYFLNYQLDKAKHMGTSVTSSSQDYTYNSRNVFDNVTYTSKLEVKIENNGGKEIVLDMNPVIEKIESMYSIVVGFMSTQVMKELDRAEPVRSPIRKTNAILKDPDLNKCLELWEILEGLLNDMELERLASNKGESDKSILEGLDLTNYLNYCILTKKENEVENHIELNPKEAFSQIIKQYIRRKEVTIDNFRKTIVKDFDVMCKKYIQEYDDVNNLYELVLDKYEDILNSEII
jgi:hypothetical protein